MHFLEGEFNQTHPLTKHGLGKKLKICNFYYSLEPCIKIWYDIYMEFFGILTFFPP